MATTISEAAPRLAHTRDLVADPERYRDLIGPKVLWKSANKYPTNKMKIFSHLISMGLSKCSLVPYDLFRTFLMPDGSDELITLLSADNALPASSQDFISLPPITLGRC